MQQIGRRLCAGAARGWLAVCLLTACGSGDLTLNEADPDVVSPKPAFAQVYPIFQRDCTPCHSGTDEGDGDDDGRGRKAARTAGVEPGLESCRSIVKNLRNVEETIFVDNDMPPGAWPRLTSMEKLTIERWIAREPETRCD